MSVELNVAAMLSNVDGILGSMSILRKHDFGILDPPYCFSLRRQRAATYLSVILGNY